MNRKHLRKVDFFHRSTKDFHKDFHRANDPEVQQGWFHEWAQCGDMEHGLEKFALVEDEQGLMFEIAAHQIRFFT